MLRPLSIILRLIVAFSALQFLCFVVHGQPAPAGDASTLTDKTSAALSPELMRLRREGNEALYNLDSAAAVKKYEEIRRKAPDHPAGDLFLATAIWISYLNKTRRLQTGLYGSGSSFYNGVSKSKDSEGDEVDSDLDHTFRELMAQAKMKALALVGKNWNDADAQYYLGAYYGVMAAYEATVARRFFSAMRNGSRCIDAHEKALKLKPDYYDAYLSLGVYDYIAGSLPFGYKLMATMVGVHGNKKRGIGKLQTIIDHEAPVADDARVLLVAIFQNENSYEDALALIDQLCAKYPSNFLLKLERSSALVTLDRFDEAFATFESMLNEPAADSARDLIHYRYAEALARARQYRRAASEFIAVSQVEGGDANLATLSRLRAGQMHDLAGDRKEAVSQYKAVLSLPNVYDTKQQAEKGLNKPFMGK